MSHNKNHTELINLLVIQEELVSQLYAVFAEQFPEHQAFWLELSQEETLHAQWLKRLYARTQTGTGHVQGDHLDRDAIQNHVDQLRGLLAQVQNVPLCLIEALRAAQGIEKAVCENNYFEIFEGLSEWAEFKQVQLCLAEATRHHVDTIDVYLNQIEEA